MVNIRIKTTGASPGVVVDVAHDAPLGPVLQAYAQQNFIPGAMFEGAQNQPATANLSPQHLAVCREHHMNSANGRCSRLCSAKEPN